jgi:hypothetical protein
MRFIYVSEIQEEALMDNKQNWKKGKETYTSYRKFKGRKIIRERDPERNISII